MIGKVAKLVDPVLYDKIQNLDKDNPHPEYASFKAREVDHSKAGSIAWAISDDKIELVDKTEKSKAKFLRQKNRSATRSL